MANAQNPSGILKSLIIIGIVAVLGYFWFSGNILSSVQLLSSASAKQNDSYEEAKIEPEVLLDIPQDLRASAQIDWSMFYGNSRQERNTVSAAISEASITYGVKADLLRAVIMAESVFDPNAVSRKGARGLMQLMPATARELGVFDASDPRENILGGAAYLASLLKKFSGDSRLALAAYNAGPQTISNANNTIPSDILPYVNRVMSYYSFFSGGQ